MKPRNRDTYCFRTSRLLRLRFAEMPKHVLPTAAEYQNEPVRQPALRVIDLNAEASGEMLISWHVLDIICVYFPSNVRLLSLSPSLLVRCRDEHDDGDEALRNHLTAWL